MALSLVSFSYKNTPLTLRERLAVPTSRLPELLLDARQRLALDEFMVLSTCNRVEFYSVGREAEQGTAPLLDWMRASFAGFDADLESSALHLTDGAALMHLFRVASSLESMVIGEPQILGQVKEGYQIAVDTGTVGPQLSGLMQRAFRTAKRVRTETDIARFPVSISYVAAELAGRIFDHLDEVTVMVIGAGEMAELVIKHLQKAGVRRLLITNRTFANAVALAERFQGSAVQFDQRDRHLAQADIVVGSTGAPGYVVDLETARRAQKARRGNPTFYIDIAVPRDIDPAVNELSDVYCYDVDDLQATADANQRERESEALLAQGLVEEEVARYQAWQASEAVVPVVKALRRHFHATGDAELNRALEHLSHLPPEDTAALQRLVRGVVNKLLHVPSTRLKALGAGPDGRHFAEALSTVFELDPDASAVAESGDDGTGGEAATDNVLPLPSKGRGSA